MPKMVRVLIKEIYDDDMSIWVHETWKPKLVERHDGKMFDKGFHDFTVTVKINMPSPKKAKWLTHTLNVEDYDLFIKQVMEMRERA